MTETPNYSAEQLRVAADWLDITVQRFQRNLKTLRINNTGNLTASFLKQVVAEAGGDQLKVRIAYALYGRFVDQGVGRGMAAGVRRGQAGFDQARNELGQLRRHNRRPKPWYSREIGYQSHRLAELISEVTGQILISILSNALPQAPTEINL